MGSAGFREETRAGGNLPATLLQIGPSPAIFAQRPPSGVLRAPDRPATLNTIKSKGNRGVWLQSVPPPSHIAFIDATIDSAWRHTGEKQNGPQTIAAHRSSDSDRNSTYAEGAEKTLALWKSIPCIQPTPLGICTMKYYPLLSVGIKLEQGEEHYESSKPSLMENSR